MSNLSGISLQSAEGRSEHDCSSKLVERHKGRNEQISRSILRPVMLWLSGTGICCGWHKRLTKEKMRTSRLRRRATLRSDVMLCVVLRYTTNTSPLQIAIAGELLTEQRPVMPRDATFHLPARGCVGDFETASKSFEEPPCRIVSRHPWHDCMAACR
jgi:hypothetical protein